MAGTIALRNAIADFYNIGTPSNPVWTLLGMGFNSLDESPNAQVESKVYIHQKEASPSITRYEPSFPFDTDMFMDQEATMDIYAIARDRKTGSDAIREYVRTDFLVEEDGTPITTKVKARKFNVAVEVSDIQGGGGETITMSGNFNQVGEFVDGIFDLETRTFDDEGTLPAKTVKALTVTLKTGQTTGKMKVIVSPDKNANNKYLYKVSSSAITEPDYNDVVSEGWTAWDGSDEITVAASNYVGIAEVSNANRVKGYGTVQNSAS